MRLNTPDRLVSGIMCTNRGRHTHWSCEVRTNIDIDDDLLDEAMRTAGTATKKETVQLGLESLVRLGRQTRLRDLRGKLTWEGDLDETRGRPR